jgi:SulP family sulfate permease
MPSPLNILRSMLMQPVEEARQYTLGKARSDMIAGLTVAVVAVPQSMAYAYIAGLNNPVYGLYTVIIQCLIGSLFNSQKFLSVGPINTQSLLVAATVTRVMREFGDLSPEQYDAIYLQMVFGLTIIKGVMQLGLSALRMGNLVRYVSQSVIIGFTAGAGVLIAAGQINNFLGFSVQRTSENWPGLVGIFQRLAPHLHEISWQSVTVGLVALATVIGARLVSRLAPGPLLAVVIAAAIVAATGWTPEQLPLVKPLPQGLPAPQIPDLGELNNIELLLSGAFALSLLGLMEAYSIGKNIASKTGQRISANQELLSQGLTNFVSGFFQCIPGSGSFSRSALNFYAGAQTLYAGVFNSLFVLAIFLLLAPLATYIPMASLAAILFIIAYGLIDWRAFRRMLRTSRADAIACGATFLFTLFIPLQYAVFAGILLNIAIYLRRASEVHLAEMVQTPAGPFQERPLRDREGQEAVMFLQLEGDLFFGQADELQDKLSNIAAGPTQVVVMRLKRTLSIDATILSVFEQFIQNMHAQDKHVIFCGVKPELTERFRAYGTIDLVGEENFFETQYGVFTSAKQALRRARQLIGRSIDTDEMDLDGRGGQPHSWSYEI